MLLLALSALAQAPDFDPLPLEGALVGEWVSVATNGSDYKAQLWLTTDGRFTQKFVEGGSKRHQTVSGTYQFGKSNRRTLEGSMARIGERADDLPDWKMVRLMITFEAAGKWGMSKKDIDLRKKVGEKNFAFKQLIFEKSPPVLHDLLTIVYAKKGQEAGVKPLLEQTRKP